MVTDRRKKKIVAYELVPVYDVEDNLQIANCACIICSASGEYLSGSNGGGEYYLSPNVVANLVKTDGFRCVVQQTDLMNIKTELERTIVDQNKVLNMIKEIIGLK